MANKDVVAHCPYCETIFRVESLEALREAQALHYAEFAGSPSHR